MADALRTLKLMLLGELYKRLVTIPAAWKSNLYYDALVQDGTAAPVINVSPLMRGYTITEAGRKLLRKLAQ